MNAAIRFTVQDGQAVREALLRERFEKIENLIPKAYREAVWTEALSAAKGEGWGRLIRDYVNVGLLAVATDNPDVFLPLICEAAAIVPAASALRSELESDLWCGLMRILESYDPSGCAIVPFVRKGLLWRSRNFLRGIRKHPLPAALVPEPIAEPADDAYFARQAQALRAILEQRDPCDRVILKASGLTRQQRLCLLHRLDGLNGNETAARMGIGPQRVSFLAAGGQKRLRTFLKVRADNDLVNLRKTFSAQTAPGGC